MEGVHPRGDEGKYTWAVITGLEMRIFEKYLGDKIGRTR